MTYFTKRKHFFDRYSADIEPVAALIALSAGLCTGAITAIYLNDFGALSEFCTAGNAASGFCTKLTGAFLKVCLFPVTAFFLGSSFYGYILLPVLSAFFGYFIYCYGAFELTKLYQGELLAGLFMLGAPVLFLVPCFFVIAAEAFMASRQFHMLISRRSIPLYAGRTLHLLYCIPFLALAALLGFVFAG